MQPLFCRLVLQLLLALLGDGQAVPQRIDALAVSAGLKKAAPAGKAKKAVVKKAAAVKRHYKRVRSMQLPKKLY